MREDQKGNKRNFNYKSEWRPKITHFLVSKQGLTGRREGGRRRRGRKREIKQGMDLWILSMKLYGFWYDFYTQTTWVWIARVFFGD